MADLTDDDLRHVMAEWMREISRREEHCPLTKPELLQALRQIHDGHPVTVTGDPSIPRKQIRMIHGRRTAVAVGHALLPAQVARLGELIAARRGHAHG